MYSFFVSVGVYLIYFLSCHLRNCVVSWFMVGLCVCISIGDFLDAFVDIPNHDTKFLFLQPPSDVAFSESQITVRLFSPLPVICKSLEVWFICLSKTFALINIVR